VTGSGDQVVADPSQVVVDPTALGGNRGGGAGETPVRDVTCVVEGARLRLQARDVVTAGDQCLMPLVRV
jgi:hypothetical protein